MADLQVDQRGQEILTAWWRSASTTDEDRQLVSDVFDTIKADTWRGRWYYTCDQADPSTITIQPRDDLYIVLRSWDGSYDFLTIAHLPDEDDEESTGKH